MKRVSQFKALLRENEWIGFKLRNKEHEVEGEKGN